MSTANVCQAPYESDFDDIAGSAHRTNIRCMADYGLTEGLRGGDSYGPRLSVSRGQMASFITRFIEEYTDQSLPPGNPARFDDVPPAGYVHASNINKLARIGVVAGTGASDGRSYGPNLAVTRGQMASFIRRAVSYIDDGEVANLSEPPNAPVDYFADDRGSTHEANINALANEGIVAGFNDGTYRPNANVMRDQMASFVMRAFAYAVAEDLGRDEPEPEPEPGPETTVTVAPDTVMQGGSVTATFAGDVEDIDAVAVAGGCVEDGALERTAGVATVDIQESAPVGTCTLTFTVTYGDGSAQALTADITVTPLPTAAQSGQTYPGGTIDACVFDTDGDLEEIWATYPDDAFLSFLVGAGDSITVDGDQLDPANSDDADTLADACVAGTVLDVDYDTTEGSDFTLFTADADRVTNTVSRESFSTISDAVAAADEDDVLIARGDFAETVTVDVDGLSILAAEDADAALSGSFVIDANTVTISGFTLSDYDTSVDDVAGVYFLSGTGHEVSDNTFDTGLTYGVDDIPAPLTGISAPAGSNVEALITGNTFVGHNLAVYLNPSVDFDIDDNTFTDNFVGIGVDSTEADITGNTFDRNYWGVGLSREGAVLTGNTFGADHTAYICDDDDNYTRAELESDNTFEEGPIYVDGCLVPTVDDGVTNVTQATGYDTIGEAVAAADEDDVLEARGAFEEDVELSTAGVTISGIDDATLTGSFAVFADDVTIEGFTFDGYGGDTNLEAAVLVSGASGVLVQDNTFTGDGDGDVIDRGIVVTPDAANEVDVIGNVFTDNDTGVFVNAGTVVVDANTFEGNAVGISNDGATALAITDNVFVDAGIEAIGLAADDGLVITGNAFQDADGTYICTYADAEIDEGWAGSNSFAAGPEVEGRCLVANAATTP